MTTPASPRRSGSAQPAGPFTLAIDIGGTGLKATVLDENGEMLVERVRVDTPSPCPPAVMVETLAQLVAPLPPYDRVSVGFPGVVRRGKIRTAHNLGEEAWKGFDLDLALTDKLGKPVRVLNDADIQGLGAIVGEGVEMVITLGTGLGSSLFEDGRSFAHLELAHHPFRKDETYEEQLGNAALDEVGKKKWNKRLLVAIDTLRVLTNFDHLYLGGGNARKVEVPLPPDVSLTSNDFGLRGGLWLWKDRTPGSTEIYRAQDR
ncbi:MAG TPA: ROK family protein [Chthoniobacteraceae bacterium]|jgi:polyphosphate glucokinase|nr:ROK family protein [Chthoniobacteraceae bacterium]